jgi:hypothetical protein
MHALTVAAVMLLLLVCAWVVPTPAAQQTFTAPFTVKGPNSGRVVIENNSTGTGLIMRFYNASGGLVLSKGATAEAGAGYVIATNPDGVNRVTLGVSPTRDPGIHFASQKYVAFVGSQGGHMFFAVDSEKGNLVKLGENGGNGYLILSDAQSTSRVEAGTQKNGNGAVKVYGPTGKCGVALAGIPCMIVAR